MSNDGKLVVYGILTVLLLIFGIGVGCTSCTLVEPGNVGLRISKTGANRGVQDLPTVSGYVWCNPLTEQVVEFPTTSQTVIWSNAEAVNFSSSDGTSISADVAISYHVEPTRAGRLYTRFRQTDISVLTHGYVRNVVRDAINEVASTMATHDIYGPGKTQLMNRALDLARNGRPGVSGLQRDGFMIDQLSFQGALRLPPNVVDAINRAMQATQDAVAAQNRVSQIEAEARQRIAEANGRAEALRAETRGQVDAFNMRLAADLAQRRQMAEAEAAANERLSRSITPEILEWHRLRRWNGQLPTVQGGNATPMISIPRP